jgi:hypothetical protein
MHLSVYVSTFSANLTVIDRTYASTRTHTSDVLSEPDVCVRLPVYVSTFSANLTVIARAMSPGLVFTLLLRRAEKPTLNLHIGMLTYADVC